MSRNRVSCVIPTHGRPEFLREALSSVFAQTLAPYEVIVVSDDGNSESQAVVKSFAERGLPVRYVHNEAHPGASGSRNAGARLAEGDWLSFLDDDDLWAPQFLEHAVDVADRNGADCVVTWLEMFRGDMSAPGLRIRPGVPARRAASRNPGITGSNFIIEKDAFNRIGGFDPDLRVMNDLDFFYRYLLGGGSYAVNPRPEVLQRKHAEGQLTRATEMRARGIEQYIAKHRSTMSFVDVRQLRLAMHRIRYHAASSRLQKARHLLLGALHAGPSNVFDSVSNLRKRRLWRER